LDKNNKNNKKKSLNLLTGSGLFLFLVTYFNIRSDKKMTSVDWLVIACGAAVFCYALITKFIKSRTNK
jgi:hypothetical protein